MALLESVNTACQELGVSRRTLYRMLDSGQISSVTVGKRGRRIPRAELERVAQVAQ